MPEDGITETIAKSELAKKLKAKVKARLERVEPGRVRRWCIAIIVMLLIWDGVLVARIGHRLWGVPRIDVIQAATTIGSQRQPPVRKTFLAAWDSLMADPATRDRWDSLVKVRPGLIDTLRMLHGMDSGRSGEFLPMMSK